ncbi:transposase [Streptomyces sp. NPDC048362]|uniref:transposase n=1 Tax=Streptomyces sp. NPDC048362 TaxID=3365539 RepID=UPI00371547A7
MEDDLWALIEPLLPPWPRKVPGPKPVHDRLCLQGILYVPKRRELAAAATGAVLWPGLLASAGPMV